MTRKTEAEFIAEVEAMINGGLARPAAKKPAQVRKPKPVKPSACRICGGDPKTCGCPL